VSAEKREFLGKKEGKTDLRGRESAKMYRRGKE